MGSESEKGDRKRVLVVEDDPDFSMVVRDFLRARGFQVTCFANGAEALRAVMSTDFEVVVCDVVMPRMPGDMFYEAVRRVKAGLCDRFIFITGHAESAKVREFLAQVSDWVLKKPFHLEDLDRTIRLLLRDLEDRTRRLDAL